MFAASLSRPIASLAQIFARPSTKPTQPQGPMPSWLSDQKMSEQLLKDTGLTPEDLGVRPSYDANKPFFMQQTLW